MAWKKATERPPSSLWSPDGKELLYGRAGARLVSVSIATNPTFANGKPVKSRLGQRGQDGGPDTIRNFDITPDGKSFLSVVDASSKPFGLAGSQIQVVLNRFEELKARAPNGS